MGFISKMLGSLLYLIYSMVNNYAVSIILFTILVKVLLLPLTLNQLKQTKNMQKIQPQLKKLQDKYKNDKETLKKILLLCSESHHIRLCFV